MWEQEGRSRGGSLNCMFGVCGEIDWKKKKKRKGAERLVSGGRMTYFRWQMCARA